MTKFECDLLRERLSQHWLCGHGYSGKKLGCFRHGINIADDVIVDLYKHPVQQAKKVVSEVKKDD